MARQEQLRRPGAPPFREGAVPVEIDIDPRQIFVLGANMRSADRVITELTQSLAGQPINVVHIRYVNAINEAFPSSQDSPPLAPTMGIFLMGEVAYEDPERTLHGLQVDDPDSEEILNIYINEPCKKHGIPLVRLGSNPTSETLQEALEQLKNQHEGPEPVVGGIVDELIAVHEAAIDARINNQGSHWKGKTR